MARIEGNSVTIETDWDGVKSQIDTRQINFRFEETETAYEIFAIDGQYVYHTIIYKSSQAPQDQASHDVWRTDFENNYKNRITDFTSTQPFYLSNEDGYSVVLKDGATPTANDGYGIAVIASDGSNYRMLKSDTSGRPILVGAGTAGTPTGGILTIQGDPSGTPLPISGNITASNASVSDNDQAIPLFSNLIGGSDGTNLRPLRTFDLDSGAGTQWVLGVGLRKSAGGGSVEFGTSSDPIRIDPTGTTTQPISGTVTANQGGSWTVAGTGNFTVVQSTASNLRAQLSSESTYGNPIPATALLAGGSDGTNLRPFFMDSSGRLIVIGAATNGTAVTGNPVLIAGSDGTNARSVRTATDGTIRIDPTGTTTQPISGTVTANQGTAAALSGKWPVQITDGTNTMPTGDVASRAVFHKITDGTNTAAVKAASTAAAAADPSLVVGLSPNSLLPQGPFANAVIANPNPYVIAGRTTSDGYIRTVLVDTNGQLVTTTNNPASTTIELSSDDSVSVAGAQAGYYYSALVYTVPTSYTLNCVQFNSSSADNRVTARVSKFIVGGNYNLGTDSFTTGSSYTSPNFGAYLEAEVTTVIGGTSDVILTATYTNSNGTSGRTATATVKKNTPVGYKVIFLLQSGDYGVLSVQNVTRNTANTGTFSIKLGVEFYLQTMTTANLNYILATGTQALIARAGEFIELAWSSNAAATSERVIKVLGTLTPTT